MSAESAKAGHDCTREIPKLLSKAELQALSRIDSLKFSGAAVLEYAQVVAAVWVSEYLWFNPVVYLISVVVIGSRINGLGALMHDAAHYRAYRLRWLNELVGELLALPTSASMAGYRNSHFAHHRALNSDQDPDWTRNLGAPEYEFPAPRRQMWSRVSVYLSGLKAFGSLKGFHGNKITRDVPKILAILRAVFFLALVVAAVEFGFFHLVVLYWLVPLFTVFLTIRYFRSVAEHYAVEHDHVFNESRTVIAPFWQLWLIAPWGLNYHLAHHLYPSVPCFRLKELHDLLMTREEFRARAHVTHGYFRGLFADCAVNPDPRTGSVAP
jgi:fatty acid desaturase